MTSTTNYTSASQNPYASASLYVGDLSPETTEATLFELFNAVGPVASIRVCRDATTRKSLGYAYVNFHSVADADRALDTMNFTNIKGKQCRIMWSQRDPSIRKSGKGNVFVKNLHPNIDNKTLYDTFSVFGSILSCKIVKDRNSGESRGYGYVHYVRPEDAKKAIEGVNGMLIQDMKVQAELFKSREERQKNLHFTNIYIKYIPNKMTEEELYAIVRETLTGNKDDDKVITHKKFWTHPYGKCSCINLLSFEYAKLAVEKLNGLDVSSYLEDDENDEKNDEEKNNNNNNNNSNEQKTKLFVARCQKRKDRDRLIKSRKSYRGRNTSYNNKFTGINLYVKNLHSEISDEKLKEMFSGYGRIVSARVMKDHTGKSRGFGFVSFVRKEDATKAMFEMNSKVFHDKPLYVSRAQKKEQRRQFLAKQRNRIQQQHPNYNGPMYPGFPSRQMYNPNTPFGPTFGAPFGPPQGLHPMQMGGGPRPQMQPFGRQPFGPYGVPNQPQNIMNLPHPFGQPQQRLGHFPTSVPFGMQQQPQQLSQQQISQHQQQQTNSQLNTMNQSVGRQPMSGPIHQQIATSVPRSSQPPFPTNNSGIVAQVPSQQVSSQPTQSTSQIQATSNPIMQINQSQQSGSQLNQPQQSVTSQLSAPMREQNPLTSNMLANADPAERKRLIGERLFPKIQEVEPRLAGKITGMLLEMDNTELLVLLENKDNLVKKINEALGVLRDHRLRQSQKNEQPDSAAQRTSAGNQGSTRNQQSSVPTNTNLSSSNQN